MSNPQTAAAANVEAADSLRQAITQHGVSLAELSERSPLLVVFLRHAGCTFCREALADIARQRGAIEAAGARIALVHMGSPEQGADLFAHYGLADVGQVSDPEQRLYRAFQLERGGLRQLLGPKVWWRGFKAAILDRHGFGRPPTDVRQMPGAFLIRHGRIVRSFRHATAADRPDYAALACDVATPR
jgi:peroxiredoxin